MKKRFFIFVLFFAFCKIFCFDIQYIDTSKIKKVQKYADELDFLYKNAPFLNEFIPDEYWKAPISKAEYREKLKDILKILAEYPENKNQEYLLLKAYVCEALYHLDADDSYEETVRAYNAIEKIKDNDYRYKWFLGSFYAHAGKPFEAIKQFEYILERIPREKLHPDFIADYAYAELLALMPKRAISDLLYYYDATGLDPASNKLLRSLQDDFIDYKDGDVPFTEVFLPVERESGKGFFSRLLGLWLPLASDDQPRFSNLSDGSVSIQIRVPIKAAQYSGSTYSIMITSFLSNDKKVTRIIESLPNRKKITLAVSDQYEIYEYSNTQEYIRFGGMHGLLAIVRAPYNPALETEIEAPLKASSSGDAPGFHILPFKKEFNRYKGELIHIILLDSAEGFYKESVSRYIDLLNNMQIK
ncbi:tetratricopeptide repeat protein [Treponema socranskii]|uniref:tetratricopeptide repeat protein n=1 Tax=Treponema socranskii TaxID=53419 RepID=UPI003D8F878D